MEIMADANQAQSAGGWQPGVRWDLERAVATARELERLGCRWLEEPLPRYAFDLLAELSRRVELPIAGGENNCGLHEFRWLMERGVYDIVQPDSLVSGGITELREIGALAEAFGKRVVPHHGGGGLGTIAHLHLVAAWPHAPYLELLHEPPIGSYRHRFAIFQDPPVGGRDGSHEPSRGARPRRRDRPGSRRRPAAETGGDHELPQARQGRASRCRRSASATGSRTAKAACPTTSRAPASAARSSWASTSSTPPTSTAAGWPRRSSAAS